jgi:hypothetical protein
MDSGTAPDSGVLPRVLQKLTGDGQSGVAGTQLASSLTVRVTDLSGRPVSSAPVSFTISSGSVGAASVATKDDGSAQTSVTLSMTPGTATVTATLDGALGSPVTFAVRSTGGLVYIDPPDGGKVRLVRDQSQSAQNGSPYAISLALVSNQAAAAYSVGFNLPIDNAKVRMAPAGMTPGTVLPAGDRPAAARALIPAKGPLKGQLVSAQSQKASGTGATATDAQISSGAVFYTLHLEAVPGAPAGVVFDGATVGAKLQAGLRDKAGNDVAHAADFAIGRLELR